VTDGGDPVSHVIRGEIRNGAMPGAAWWVGDARGACASGCAGHAVSAPDPVPVKPETPFDLASLTKPLATALLATMLDREGRLRLDAPLRTAFPELGTSPYGAATLRDAAAHRAGFPAWAPLYLTGTTRESYVAAIAACEPHGPVGQTLYSDLGYILLGFALERAADTSLDALFAERIARPSGLSRCGFASGGRVFSDAAATERQRSFEESLAGPSPQLRAEIPRGQVHDGNAWGLLGVAGHAGLFGTAEEVSAIALAILDPPRLGLPVGALDGMLHPVAAETGARTVGFLRANDADSVRGLLPDAAVGHMGFTGTSVWIDPARPRVYTLLTNRVHPRVPTEPFTPTRRAFHAAAAAVA
jgi:serine-type D-Ala-D-Ala carboxypeptidase